MLTNWPRVYDILPAHLRRTAVFFLSETKLPDCAALRVLTGSPTSQDVHSFRGMRYITCSRLPTARELSIHPATHDNAIAIVSGGVAAVTMNPAVKLRLLHHHHRGALAVALTTPGYDSVAVINVYNPPAGAAARTTGSSTTADGADPRTLLAIITDWHAELSSKFRTVIMCGDWNMRAGPHRGRRTEDASPAVGRRHAFVSFMDATRTQILHGSEGQEHAHLTSRVITDGAAAGSSEVDAFLVPLRPQPAAATLVALPLQVPWHLLPYSMTHVPVCAVLHMQPRAGRNPPAPNGLVRPIARLPYCDRRHILAAPHVAAAALRAAALSHTATPDEVNTALVLGLRAAARAADRQHVMLLQSGPRLAARARMTSGPPSTGHLSPARLATYTALRLARRATARAADAHHAQRRAVARAPPDTAAAAAAHASLRHGQATHRAADKALRGVERRLLATRLRAHVRSLEVMRRRDPNGFFRAIESLNMADLHTAPNNRPTASLDELYAHYRHKFTATGPAPPACDGSWDAFIPKASAGSGDRIAAPVQWWELYLLLYPADQRILTFFQPCSPGCTLCTEYETRLRKWVPPDPDSEPPEWKPSLHTCKAAGEDGLIAELLSFTRTGSGGNNWEYRKGVSTHLAEILSSWLRDGVPSSEGFRQVIVSAPAKPLRPGAAPPANPAANTRPISVEVLMAKVFELLINSRTEHWRFNERLISAPQVAFSQLLSPDHHVLVLRELIQMRRAQGCGTNVLFVDFRAAYDSVHHTLLWHVLRVMGFPHALIGILSAWLGSRTGRLKVDGELSEPFPMTMGVPQGGPLSTTLWNLFIEPLSRRLASELPGVSVRAPRRPDGTPLSTTSTSPTSSLRTTWQSRRSSPTRRRSWRCASSLSGAVTLAWASTMAWASLRRCTSRPRPRPRQPPRPRCRPWTWPSPAPVRSASAGCPSTATSAPSCALTWTSPRRWSAASPRWTTSSPASSRTTASRRGSAAGRCCSC